jgi:hypothetical protein
VLLVLGGREVSTRGNRRQGGLVLTRARAEDKFFRVFLLFIADSNGHRSIKGDETILRKSIPSRRRDRLIPVTWAIIKDDLLRVLLFSVEDRSSSGSRHRRDGSRNN